MFSTFFKILTVIANLDSAPEYLPKHIPQKTVEFYVKKKLEQCVPERKKLFEEDPYFVDLVHTSIYHAAEIAADKERLGLKTRERDAVLCNQGWRQALLIRSQAAQGVFSEKFLASERLSGVMQEMRADKKMQNKNQEVWRELR